MSRVVGQFEDPLDALAETGGDSASSIDAWLNVASRLMHLPESTRAEISSELREHLRERVRDLLLSGCDEAHAVRQAIDELGETAQLARRFEAANKPQSRRPLMHAMLTLLGAGAVAAGVMTFSPNHSGSNPASRYEAAAANAAPPKALADLRCSLVAETSLRDALQSVIDEAGVGLMVDWGEIQNNGVEVDAPLGIVFTGMPGPQALTLIAQSGGGGVFGLDWRMRENNLVEFGLRSSLDRREIELLTYDIAETLAIIADHFANSREEANKQVMELLTSMVEPENWQDNGGDLASMKLVGGRLFVQAPSRMQGKVKWMLDQLPNDAGAGLDVGHDAKADAAPVRRVLNPGDTVTLSVFELYRPGEWYTTTRQIDEVGMYRVAELGDIRAAGMNKDQFRDAVASQLKAKVTGVQPQVDVKLESTVAIR